MLSPRSSENDLSTIKAAPAFFKNGHQALARFLRIEWYITGSSFENGKQGHRELGRSLHADRDGTAGPGAQRLQVSRDCVATFMQLPIGQALRFRSNCQGSCCLFNPP